MHFNLIEIREVWLEREINLLKIKLARVKMIEETLGMKIAKNSQGMWNIC